MKCLFCFPMNLLPSRKIPGNKLLSKLVASSAAITGLRFFFNTIANRKKSSKYYFTYRARRTYWLRRWNVKGSINPVSLRARSPNRSFNQMRWKAERNYSNQTAATTRLAAPLPDHSKEGDNSPGGRKQMPIFPGETSAEHARSPQRRFIILFYLSANYRKRLRMGNPRSPRYMALFGAVAGCA